MRDTLFISHATPDDNEFAIWLASRLEMLGYKVWLDKNALLGGEKFWEEIDNVIRNEAAKVILVYSQSICLNGMPGKLKDGISKELSLAESIAKAEKLDDFIVLGNIDGAEYNLFIGADRLNQIPFCEDWAEGLKLLTKKLEKEKIPKAEKACNHFGTWYANEYVSQNSIIKCKELYYSNWWKIRKLPEYFYIHEFKSEDQAKEIYEQAKEYPIGKIANHLSSFQPDISITFFKDGQEFSINPENTFQVKLEGVLSGFVSEHFPTLADAQNHLKVLLKRVFHLTMKKKKLIWYEFANKRLAYFYTPANLPTWKVKFEYPYRDKKKFKNKALIGIYKKIWRWHFAISVKPILYPILAFSLKNHLVFSDNGFDIWDDKKKVQSHRRTKGKGFYNEEWRDLMLAFINALKDSEDVIEIPLSSVFTLKMPACTEVFQSDFGYYDPKEKNRHGILEVDNFEEIDEEEEFDEGGEFA